MDEYILIQANEDGEPITWLSRDEVNDMLKNPEDYGVKRFIKSAVQDDPNYWKEGDSMLLKVEILMPKEVITKYVL